MKIISVFWISVLLIFCSCSQRDTGHIYGNMSKDSRLQEIHQYFSSFRPESYEKAYQMVEAIDPKTLNERDYYEWLELKCNTANCAGIAILWIQDIRQWVEYAVMKGSDRDVLAAYRWLAEAITDQPYKHRERAQRDSISNLQLQELFFCIHYKEEEEWPKGDYKCILADCYDDLADRFRRWGSRDYLQMAQYKEQAANLMWQAMEEDESIRTQLASPRWYRTLLRSAAIGYREGGEYAKANACIDRCLEHARQENYLIDIYRCLGVKGSIEVWDRLSDRMVGSFKELDPDDTWISDNIKYYDEGIQNFPPQNTFALELFYYKAMAYLCCEKIDSAMYYIDRLHTPYEAHWTKTMDDGTVVNKERTTELYKALGLAWENTSKVYSFSDYIRACHADKHKDKEVAYRKFKNLAFAKFREANNEVFFHSPVAEEIAKSHIQNLKERQRIAFYRTLAKIFSGLFVLMLILSVYVYFHNRKMRQLHASISQLNRQLDELRAEKLQKQITIESETEIPAPDDAMEPVFINKLRLKHTAFQTTSYYRLLSQIKLRYASSTNPGLSRVTVEERHALMDAILAEFVLECQQLQELYPTLTGTDSVYCILSLLDFGREVGAACMEVGEEAYRRRKSRIKPKVSEALFACLFGKE